MEALEGMRFRGDYFGGMRHGKSREILEHVTVAMYDNYKSKERNLRPKNGVVIEKGERAHARERESYG